MCHVEIPVCNKFPKVSSRVILPNKFWTRADFLRILTSPSTYVLKSMCVCVVFMCHVELPVSVCKKFSKVSQSVILPSKFRSEQTVKNFYLLIDFCVKVSICVCCMYVWRGMTLLQDTLKSQFSIDLSQFYGN